MDRRFEAHNRHRMGGLETFLAQDPQLRRLAGEPLRFRSELLDRFPLEVPGIYMLGGGRQVGKSTLAKQLMAERLGAGVPAEQIHYLTGELLSDGEDLRQSLSELVATDPAGGTLHLIIVDEVTYIDGWDMAVKFMADAGMLEKAFVLLTGSDLVLLSDALVRLPGRRGQAEQVDFHYRPLSFREFCVLRGRLDREVVERLAEGAIHADLPALAPAFLPVLEQEFRQYHVTGGYLTAINDLERDGRIAAATLRTYASWVRGDVLKQEKSETYLREVLRAILRRQGSQVTWNSLARELSINHPSTIANYAALLERMDAVIVLSALREDALSAAPKKAKKLYFSDPFIHHAVMSFIEGADAPDPTQVAVDDDALALLAEATLVSHLRRGRGAAFYIKGEGEVDAAYVKDGRFWPIEVKWTRQLRPKDLKQIAKYSNGLIAGRVTQRHEVSGVPVLPAPVVLLRAAH